MRAFNQPGRSAIYANNAAMATSHPLATHVGLQALQEGGSAIDACIAATAVLSIAEPAMTGIGGDCFALIGRSGEPIAALNGSGYSPNQATREAAMAQGLDKIPTHSPWSITVPGAVAAWEQLHKDYGKLSWQRILQPAIDYAQQGVPIHERVALDWQTYQQDLLKDADTAELYLNDGHAYLEGEIFKQAKLAQTLTCIAQQGASAFYTGPIAEDIVNKLNRLGGCHQLEDFAYQLNLGEDMYVQPVAQDFQGVTLWECPPNGQGITAQVIVAIMANFNVASLDQTDYHHLLAEATKLAYQLRDNCISDPTFMGYTAEEILHPEFIKSLAANINMQQATPTPASLFPNHKDTIYLCCVDQDGLNVSFINSIFNPFGSAISAPESGILLQSRGASFNLHKDHANALAPRKRPMHTIIPAMLTKADRIVGPLGVMGGHYQACGHAHVLNLMLNFGHPAQAALDAPRSFAYEDKLSIESSMAAEVIEGLRDKGHIITVDDTPMGGGQCILRLANGVLQAASDPRKDGLALGY